LDICNAGVHNLHMPKAVDYRALTRAILDKTEETQAELAVRLGVSQASVSRWATGKPPELHHAVLIESEAHRLRLSNRKNAGNMTSVPIVGYVGAGGEIQYDNQGPYGDAELPPKEAPPSLVAVIVRGDSMSGMLEDGWSVYYDNRRDPPDETLHAKLCIVGLRDGRVLIKKLYPGRKAGHYDLHSVNAPALLDQPVEWAARITWIAPQ
jgi:phage repressor protein C with HTH and peptisase S24 domain